MALVVALLVATPVRAQLTDDDPVERAAERMREAVQRVVVSPSLLTSGPQMRAVFRDVVAKPSGWTTRVKIDGRDAALGTVVGPDGWIVTKASQMQGEITCKLKDGRELAARVVGVQKDYDLAMLKVEAEGLQSAEWCDGSPEVGQWIASPGLEADPVAIGVISVGPRTIAKEPGLLGIVLEEAEAGGARVTQVMPESGAAQSGVLIDDIVTHCNGKQAKDRQTLIGMVREFGPGDEVELTLQRAGKEVKLRATLGRSIQGWKPDRKEVQNTMGGKLSERRHGFPTALQHDTVLQPTDCGGAIVDLEGKIIGINVARAGRTESYAVPSVVVRGLLADLMSGKLAPGAAAATITADAPKATASEVQTPGPASKQAPPQAPLPEGQPPEPKDE